jgi:ligand-binding sensor domain-containing protein
MNAAHTTSLLVVLLVHNLCTGQPGEPASSNQILAPATGLPKVVKTQGSSEHDNIHAMLQDKAGNLWLATTGEGVYRYDGTSFLQFTQKEGLASNAVYSMLEDTSGKIWFGTERGLSRYDGKWISPVPFIHSNGLKLFPNLTATDGSTAEINAVWSVMQDKSGTIWFGTTEGLCCYNGKNFSRFLDRFHVVNDEALKLKKIQCMLQDRQGTIWFGSGMGEVEGLCQFDGKILTSRKPKIDGWIRKILEDPSGAIWLSTRIQGIWRLAGKGFEKFQVQDERVTRLLQANQTMMQDSKGNLWFGGGEVSGGIASNSGIWKYDGTRFQNIQIPGGFGVWSMLEDKEGHIWIGTRNTGLYRFDGTGFTAMMELGTTAP